MMWGQMHPRELLVGCPPPKAAVLQAAMRKLHQAGAK